jgi:hypothetical protein
MNQKYNSSTKPQKPTPPPSMSDFELLRDMQRKVYNPQLRERLTPEEIRLRFEARVIAMPPKQMQQECARYQDFEKQFNLNQTA